MPAVSGGAIVATRSGEKAALQFGSGFGAGEEIALEFGAAEADQVLVLSFGFHALSHYLEAEAAGEGDDGGGDADVAGAQREFAHEGLVHLERVDGQALQVGER